MRVAVQGHFAARLYFQKVDGIVRSMYQLAVKAGRYFLDRGFRKFMKHDANVLLRR
jgi:hypothetical protein